MLNARKVIAQTGHIKNALKALNKSPMAIDIYMWLTYRASYSRCLKCIERSRELLRGSLAQ